ncbi:MAG: leucine-rich repeat domain-containing protein [Mycoplasmoidaceae bacterium]|nr:leucine-rich repeat domain-containing protein [Mycoplasmoidaceae bacterium]
MITIDLSKCSNLTEIKQSAFRTNNTLTSVTLPTNLEIIGAQAFTYCGQLTSVNFSECTGLTQIKDLAFDHCPLLSTSVDLENAINLTSFGQQAFRFCDSLTSISLPSNLSSLGIQTFSDCPNLSSIT